MKRVFYLALSEINYLLFQPAWQVVGMELFGVFAYEDAQKAFLEHQHDLAAIVVDLDCGDPLWLEQFLLKDVGDSSFTRPVIVAGGHPSRREVFVRCFPGLGYGTDILSLRDTLMRLIGIVDEPLQG